MNHKPKERNKIMDFFEEAVVAAKDTFNAVCKKTEEVVSVQKIKINIASMESKLAKDYEALGRYCLESVLSDENADEQAKNIAEDIVNKKAEIEKAKQELYAAQGKAVCPSCGNKVEDKAKFCSSCGQNLSE